MKRNVVLNHTFSLVMYGTPPTCREEGTGAADGQGLDPGFARREKVVRYEETKRH